MEAAGEKGVIAVAQLPLSRKLAPRVRGFAIVRLRAFAARVRVAGIRQTRGSLYPAPASIPPIYGRLLPRGAMRMSRDANVPDKNSPLRAHHRKHAATSPAIRRR